MRLFSLSLLLLALLGILLWVYTHGEVVHSDGGLKFLLFIAIILIILKILSE